jgi:hypothetical protein
MNLSLDWIRSKDHRYRTDPSFPFSLSLIYLSFQLVYKPLSILNYLRCLPLLLPCPAIASRSFRESKLDPQLRLIEFQINL